LASSLLPFAFCLLPFTFCLLPFTLRLSSRWRQAKREQNRNFSDPGVQTPTDSKPLIWPPLPLLPRLFRFRGMAGPFQRTWPYGITPAILEKGARSGKFPMIRGKANQRRLAALWECGGWTPLWLFGFVDAWGYWFHPQIQPDACGGSLSGGTDIPACAQVRTDKNVWPHLGRGGTDVPVRAPAQKVRPMCLLLLEPRLNQGYFPIEKP
jgi:hypothetical protein